MLSIPLRVWALSGVGVAIGTLALVGVVWRKRGAGWGCLAVLLWCALAGPVGFWMFTVSLGNANRHAREQAVRRSVKEVAAFLRDEYLLKGQTLPASLGELPQELRDNALVQEMHFQVDAEGAAFTIAIRSGTHDDECWVYSSESGEWAKRIGAPWANE